ncbi:MAG: exonuclease domain-containing protein [Clostridium sp.]
MAYIIIDLEFNNLYEIEKYFPDYREKNPHEVNGKVKNEIIQIGAIKIDKYMKIQHELKVFIKPSIFSVLNPKISEMTNITMTDLEYGESFQSGMDKLKAFMDKGDIICSWAKDDVREIVTNSIYHEYNYSELLDEYIDIQEYCSRVLGVQKVLGLKNALSKLKINANEELLHDALNDAYFEYQVFKRLYNARAIKNYIIKDIYKMPMIRVDNSKQFVLDSNRIEGICPKCGNHIDRESAIIPQSWRYIYLGICSKCKSKILGEVDVKKNFMGDTFYNEVGTLLSELEYSDYSYKIEHIKKKIEEKGGYIKLCNHSITN